MINGKNFFSQSVKTDLRTNYNIHYNIDYSIITYIIKIATGHRDDYTTGCLLDYLCFKKLL